MKTYLGFQYWSGRSTTTGTPNPRTGRMSIAGDLVAFATKSERDEWVARGKVTSDMQGNCRRAVSRREARALSRGSSLADFIESIEHLS